MGRMRGAAGSLRPEVNGVFLCRDEGEVEFFCGFDAHGPLVDVWAVEGVSEADLLHTSEGFVYLPMPIPPGRLRLWRSMHLPERATASGTATTAYQGNVMITLSDGRVLDGADARDWVKRGSETER